jgi:hypothetical protein
MESNNCPPLHSYLRRLNPIATLGSRSLSLLAANPGGGEGAEKTGLLNVDVKFATRLR